MALTLGDNFSYQGAKPLDARLKYDTVAAMKAVADSTLYDGCLAYCTATEKTYQWKSSNTVDTDLGRWREFESGGSVTVDSALSDASENPVQNKVIKTALDDKADLVDGKIPANQLPSYVDDVLEYEDLAHFPATGETGKIYIAQDTNKTYRWGGSAYAEISESLALGETSSTAYRGDRGKEAYDVSQTVGSVSSLTTTDKSSVVAAINEVNAKQGLQLGETSTTAYRGDRGKTAYDFSQTPYTSDPEMNGTASAGSSTAWAKGDHVHPSDSSKENSFRYSTMPTASAENEGKIVQYIGATGGGYTNGFFYKCVSDGESTPTYSWEPWSVQAGGGSGDDVFKGSLAAWNALTTVEKEAYKIVVLTQLHAMTLTVGDQYTINEKTFKVAEDLGNGVYAMQANTSWGSSAWPGYLAAGGRTQNDFANQSIAPYVPAVNTWYNDNVKAMESDDYKYGPYLITDVKAQKGEYKGWSTYTCGGPYVDIMRTISGIDQNTEVWIGTCYPERWALAVTYDGYLAGNKMQEETNILAPAFNIDTKKVVIDDNDVITPGSSAGEVFTYNPLTGGLEAAGHTIVNSNGEEMTSRMNLKFGGDFSVTDDSTNDETVVAPHRITSEEMSEIVSPLPAAQRVMPILFDETGAEYVVGWYKYANGKKKPLYQKTFEITSFSRTDNKDIGLSALNVDKIPYSQAFVQSSGGAIYPLSFIIQAGLQYSAGYFFNADKTLGIRIGTSLESGALDKVVLTVQYTKTTDTWND